MSFRHACHIRTLQPKELAELVQGANAPSASLLNGKDLRHTENRWSVPGAEGAGDGRRRILQHACEIIVAEAAVGLTLEAGEVFQLIWGNVKTTGQTCRTPTRPDPLGI